MGSDFMKVDLSPGEWDQCPCKRDPRVLPHVFLPHEDAARWPSTGQYETSSQIETLLDLQLEPPRLQNYEKIDFCCLSHLVYNISLRKSEQSNTN